MPTAPLTVLLVDLAVVVVVVLAARRGWRQGGAATLVRTVATVLGLFAGLWAAELVTDAVSPVWHLVLGLACVVGGLLIGRAAGRATSVPVTVATRRIGLGLPDRVAGAVLRGGVALVLVWVVAGLLAAVAPSAWADAVRSGRLSSPSAADLPVVGTLYDRSTGALRDVAPDDLAALVPGTGTPPAASLVHDLDERTTSTVGLVSVQACGRNGIGTGFVVAPSLVVTNAHVVRGTNVASFQTPRATWTGRVVRVDTAADLAFIRVSGATPDPLPLAGQDAANGTSAVVVGYPGGSRTAIGAVVEQRLPVADPGLPDGLALHQSYRLRADIRHGNSGSPLLDTGGRVVGVVNALLGDDHRSGLAITLDELRADLAAARTDTTPAAPGACD